MTDAPTDRAERRVDASRVAVCAVAGVVAELAFVAVRAGGAAVLLSCAIGVMSGAVASIALLRALRRHGGMSPLRLPVVVLFAVLCLGAMAQTARAGGFMLDPSNRSLSIRPSNEHLVHHSCVTAYYEAARIARDVPNIYEPKLYFVGKPGSRSIDGFHVDQYEYPPPFLVIWRGALAAGGDFLELRSMWFAIEAALLLLSIVLVAAHLGRDAGTRFAVVGPLVYLALPNQTALQMGNLQPAAICASILAMVAFARGRRVIGATLLSFVILAKIYPAILLVALLFRRDWRALALTIVAAGAWIGLTIAALGSAPLEEFLHYQLPRIASGEAFPMLKNPIPTAINHSVYGLPLKLRLLGIGAGTTVAASQAAWAFSAVLLAVVVMTSRNVARLAKDERHVRAMELAVWTLALGLATYRAPFLPQEYAPIVPVWLLGLLAASRPPTGPRVLLLVLAFALLHVKTSIEPTLVPRTAALVSFVPQASALVLFVVAAVWLWRRPSEPQGSFSTS